MEFDQHTLEAIFATFIIEPKCLARVAALLLYDEYNFGLHYFRQDTIQRQENLFKYASFTELHETIFDIQKLLRNEILAMHIFYHGSVHYNGVIMKDFLDWSNTKQFFVNRELCHAVLEYALAGQLNRTNRLTSLAIIKRYMTYAAERDLEWLSQMLADQMCPEMLTVLLVGDKRDPTHWLHKNFLSEDENDNVLLLRILTLSIAVANIQNYTRTVESLIPTTIKERLRIEKLYIDNLNVELFYQLSSKSDILDSPAYWETLTSVLFHSSSIFKRDEWILVSKEAIKSGNLSLMLAKRLLEKLLEIDPGSADLLAQLPSVYHPIATWPLDDKRSQWLRSGVLTVPRKKHIKLSIDAGLYFMNFFAEGYARKRFPLGVQLSWCSEAKATIVQSEAFIETSTQILSKRSFNLEVLDLTIVFTSWLYLIEEHRKMDLSTLFPDDDVDDNWKLFSHRIGNQDLETAILVMGRLNTLKITNLFRPIDIRSLIDSSWHGQSPDPSQKESQSPTNKIE